MTFPHSASHDFSRRSGVFGMMRGGWMRWMVLVLLGLSQLPMAAALVLGVVNPGTEHEFRTSFSDGRVEVTLHHTGAGCCHHHTGVESWLVGDGSGPSHADHHLGFGSDAPTEKSGARGQAPSTPQVPAAGNLECPAPVVPASRAPACLEIVSADLPPPGARFRGVVMRH